MNGDVSSHTLTVSHAQHQLQLSQTGDTDKFHQGNVGKYEIPHWFRFRNDFSVGQQYPEVSLHLSVCLSFSAWCPLGVTRDVHGPDEADLSWSVCVRSASTRA